MATFERIPIPFKSKGMCLSKPVYQLPEGKYRLLKNVRSYRDGELTSRPGLIYRAMVPAGDILSFRRLTEMNPSGPASTFIAMNQWGSLYHGPAGVLALAESGFSWNPPSFVNYQPDQHSEPWLYVGDSNKLRRINAFGTSTLWGMKPANVAPSAAVGGAGVLNGDYYYRLRPRNIAYAHIGGAGPAMRTPVAATADYLTVTIPADVGSDGGGVVTDVDIFRYGGTLLEWHYVGTGTPGNTYDDNMADADAAASETLDLTRLAPWPTIDVPHDGVCDTNANDITWVSGDTFNVNWAAGSQIIINGQPCTLWARPTDSTHLTIVEDVGVQNDVAFKLPSATILGQPMPYVWGPYGMGMAGAVFFACGDPYRRGWLYWTNGNDPDGTSEENCIEVTSASEPLINGCIWDGRAWVWSSERLFRIQPILGTNQFVVEEVSGAPGLFAPWAFSAEGPALFYLTRHGIVASTGGPTTSITDEDLYPLFPHEGQFGDSVDEVIAPALTSSSKLRLGVAGDYLYFDYVGIDTLHYSAVFDIKRSAWYLDQYRGGAARTLHYEDEASDGKDVLITGGHIIFQLLGTEDEIYTIPVKIKTAAQPFGDTRAQKLIGENEIEAEPQGATITARLLADNGVTEISSAAITASGRTLVDVNAGLGTMARNLMLELTWASAAVAPLVREWQPSYFVLPETSKRRATDWTDGGQAGAKLLRGCIVDADTLGVARSIEIQGDDGAVLATLTINHDGRIAAPYAITPTPTELLRVVPKDANSWRLFSVTWIFDPWPEWATIQGDYDDLGDPEAKYVRGLILTSDTHGLAVTAQIWADGALVGTISCTHATRVELPYAFSPPFVAHSLKLIPLTAWRRFKEKWIFDRHPELSRIYSPWSDGGHHGCKYVRGALVGADTGGVDVAVQVQIDGGAIAGVIWANHAAQSRKPYSFAAPFPAYLLRLVPTGDWRLFDIEWTFDPWADLAEVITAWSDLGYQGAKFLQGCRINADTAGIAVPFTVETDAGDLIALTATHSGRQTVPYSWNPVICHQVRVRPGANWRLFERAKNQPDIDWIWEPAPELALIWETQETTHDLPGYQHVRDGYIAYMGATANITLTVTVDGVPYVYTITPPNAGYHKHDLNFQPMKGLAYKYRLESAQPFRLFKKDLEIRVKSWGESGGYRIMTPFGDISRESGARI